MKSVAGGVLTMAMLLCFGSNANAAGKSEPRPLRICVLDQLAILKRATVALNMAAQFQQIRQHAQTNYEQAKRTLDADERALESVGASLPPAALASRREEVAQRRASLAARGEQINRDLAQLDTELTNNVAKLSMPVVRTVEAEQGCSMLIARESLLNLHDPSLDITSIVINRMNAAPRNPAATR